MSLAGQVRDYFSYPQSNGKPMKVLSKVKESIVCFEKWVTQIILITQYGEAQSDCR